MKGKNMRNSELLDKVREAAAHFLNVADELNESVSAYIDGSYKAEDEEAYRRVHDAEVIFLGLYYEYYGDRIKPALNYDVAESMLQ